MPKTFWGTNEYKKKTLQNPIAIMSIEKGSIFLIGTVKETLEIYDLELGIYPIFVESNVAKALS